MKMPLLSSHSAAVAASWIVVLVPLSRNTLPTGHSGWALTYVPQTVLHSEGLDLVFGFRIRIVGDALVDTIFHTHKVCTAILSRG